MNEKNLSCEIKEVICGFEIQRCSARKQDVFTGELVGQTKIYYDVVYDDVLVGSFKTLSAARKFARNYFPLTSMEEGSECCTSSNGTLNEYDNEKKKY